LTRVLNHNRMSKGRMIANRFEEEVSDVLSTNTPNSGRNEMSPDQDMNELDDGMQSTSKKIRKKRNAYQKIDDEIRVKLLEAVQQHGETLKAAAKRYGINYSSAKSILHTYRKEGRILKKSAQDRTLKKHPDGLPLEGMDQNFPPTPSQNIGQQVNYIQRNNFRQNLRVNTSRVDLKSESEKSLGDLPSPSSPMNKLSDNFVNLLQLNQNTGMFDENNGQQQKFLRAMNQAGYVQNLSRFHPMRAENKPLDLSPNIQTSTHSQMQQQQAQAQQSSFSNSDNPFDMLKMMDNFYINYSNSPLSSERIVKDGSSKSTGNRLAKEFDSFSDMINALQMKSSEELKDEIHIPKPLRFNTAQKLQEQLEAKMNGDEEMDWKGTIENAALDTFRTVVDAQLLLCDALKKASFLNNLVQIQKTKEGVGQKTPE